MTGIRWPPIRLGFASSTEEVVAETGDAEQVPESDEPLRHAQPNRSVYERCLVL
jgi:hypothetical protein